MALVRDTSIVEDSGEAGRLLSLPGLSNLEVGSDVTVDQMLLEAHRWAFDRLRRKFTAAQLALVTNQDALKLGVASRFAEILSAQGLIGGGEGVRASDVGDRDYWAEQAKEQVDHFKPEFSAGDEPRASAEAIPVVRNITRSPSFDTTHW